MTRQTTIEIILYFVLIIGSAFHIAAGAQYAVLMSDLQSLTGGNQFRYLFQSDAGFYIAVGCFTILTCIYLLFYRKFSHKSIEAINAAYYLTLLSMCLQASVAVYSAINTTYQNTHYISILKDVPIYTIYNQANLIENETEAEAILTFVIQLPILFYLMFIRFAEWEEGVFAVKYSSELSSQTSRQPIIS